MAVASAHEEKMSRYIVDSMSIKRAKDDYFAQCFSTHYFLHGLALLC